MDVEAYLLTTRLVTTLYCYFDLDNPESICVDESFVNVMKELREANLFTNDDIENHEHVALWASSSDLNSSAIGVLKD